MESPERHPFLPQFDLPRPLNDAAIARLFEATGTTLIDWTECFRREVGDGFPEEGTALYQNAYIKRVV